MRYELPPIPLPDRKPKLDTREPIRPNTLARCVKKVSPLQIGDVVYIEQSSGRSKWTCVVFAYAEDGETLQPFRQNIASRDLRPATAGDSAWMALEMFRVIALAGNG